MGVWERWRGGWLVEIEGGGELKTNYYCFIWYLDCWCFLCVIMKFDFMCLMRPCLLNFLGYGILEVGQRLSFCLWLWKSFVGGNFACLDGGQWVWIHGGHVGSDICFVCVRPWCIFRISSLWTKYWLHCSCRRWILCEVALR